MDLRDTVLTTLFHVTDSLHRNVITFLSVYSIKALLLMNGVCKWFARNKSKDSRQTVRAVPINHRSATTMTTMEKYYRHIRDALPRRATRNCIQLLHPPLFRILRLPAATSWRRAQRERCCAPFENVSVTHELKDFLVSCERGTSRDDSLRCLSSQARIMLLQFIPSDLRVEILIPPSVLIFHLLLISIL